MRKLVFSGLKLSPILNFISLMVVNGSYKLTIIKLVCEWNLIMVKFNNKYDSVVGLVMLIRTVYFATIRLLYHFRSIITRSNHIYIYVCVCVCVCVLLEIWLND